MKITVSYEAFQEWRQHQGPVCPEFFAIDDIRIPVTELTRMAPGDTCEFGEPFLTLN